MTRPASTRESRPALRCLSLGAGIQSSAVLLLACEGVIPRFDVALFADTGWEPKAVYANLARLRAHAAKFGIPVRTVSAGNIRDDALDPAHRFVSMPLRPPQVQDFRRGLWPESKGNTRLREQYAPSCSGVRRLRIVSAVDGIDVTLGCVRVQGEHRGDVEWIADTDRGGLIEDPVLAQCVEGGLLAAHGLADPGTADRLVAMGALLGDEQVGIGRVGPALVAVGEVALDGL